MAHPVASEVVGRRFQTCMLPARPACGAHPVGMRYRSARPCKLRGIHLRIGVVAAAASSQHSAALVTCQRCKQKFDPSQNEEGSCRYHPLLYTGGEISKAIGFVRQSSNKEDQVASVLGRTGLLRFWDCCGAQNADDPGCSKGRHLAYGE